jgi:hypothetical protein
MSSVGLYFSGVESSGYITRLHVFTFYDCIVLSKESSQIDGAENSVKREIFWIKWKENNCRIPP